MDNLNFESNVKAILECNFAGFKDEIIENACKLICNLKINDDRQKEKRWLGISTSRNGSATDAANQ